MKINPKQMEKLAKQMGIQMASVDAEEVIIRTADKDIVISNPQVSKINMGGQVNFQVAGDVSEKPREEFTEEDVEMVSGQAGSSKDAARKALKGTHGDIAESIMRLKKK